MHMSSSLALVHRTEDQHMKVHIPIAEGRGMESPICGHFGSAPAFLLVEGRART